MTMAPSTKTTSAQAGRKQSKISTFGRITKTAPVAVGHKKYLANAVPPVQDTEPEISCPGAGKKRRYDAIDDGKTCKPEEQATAPLSKKVRATLFKTRSMPTLTF